MALSNLVTILFISSVYCLFEHGYEGSPNVWYLLEKGRDRPGCGTNESNACKTVGYLLQSFNRSRHENILNMKTDTKFTISKVEQDKYPILGGLNVTLSPYNQSVDGELTLAHVSLSEAKWQITGIKTTIESSNISAASFELRSHPNGSTEARVNSTYLGSLSFKDMTSVTVDNCIVYGEQRLSGVALELDASVARIDSCLFSENNVQDPLIVIKNSSEVTIRLSDFVNNSVTNGTIYVDNRSKLNIRKCNFFANKASNNAGCVLLKHNSELYIDNSTFFNNTAENYGGAIMSEYNTKIVIGNETVFDQNKVFGKASCGGAVYVSNNVSLTFTETQFNNHMSVSQGGALCVMYNSSIRLNQTAFINNTALGSSGAIQCYTDCLINMENSTFKNNKANDGGGIESKNATVQMKNCTFENNTSLLLDTGAFTAVVNSTVRMVDCVFRKNTAGRYGPAMQLYASVSIEIENCNFTDNVALYGAGAIYAENDITLRIHKSYFVNNTASRSGGVMIGGKTAYLNVTDSYFINNTCYTLSGGVIALFGKIHIENSHFINNSAGFRGGVIAKSEKVKTEVVVKNCVFLNNFAQLDGGAIFCEMCKLVSIGSNFTGNLARNLGGGISVETSTTLEIRNGTFEGNSAQYGNGGAIGVGGGSTLDIYGGKFISNRAVYGGGAVYIYTTELVNNRIKYAHFENNFVHFMGAGLYIGPGVKVTVTNSTFTSNNADTYGAAAKIDESSEACFEGCIFQNNSATAQGGALYVKQQGVNSRTTRLKLSNCFFIDNQSQRATAIYIFSNVNKPSPELKTLQTSFTMDAYFSVTTDESNFTEAATNMGFVLSEPDPKINVTETPFASVVPEVCKGNCTCRFDPDLGANIFNCSSGRLNRLPETIEEGTNWMVLRKSNISSLSDYKPYFKHIVGLDISNSKLKEIKEDFLKKLFHDKTIKMLMFNNCNIEKLPEIIKKYQFEKLLIGNNPYRCTCHMTWMHDWLIDTTTSTNKFITDYKEAICRKGIEKVRGQPIVYTDGGKMGCNLEWYELAIPVGVTVLVVVVTLLLINRYIDAIGFQLYLKFDILTGKDDDIERLDDFDFDLFVSHSHLDNLWFIKNILPHLEGKYNFDICIPERDWDPSSPISDCITTAIDSSRRMIIVLSKNYIRSRWCMEEFYMAHTRLKEGRKKLLIPIMMEDITAEDLDPTLDLYIKSHHYIKVTDDLDLLRKKLVYAMPRNPLHKLRAIEEVQSLHTDQVDCSEPGPSGVKQPTIHGLESDKVLERLTKNGHPGDLMRARMRKNLNAREARFNPGNPNAHQSNYEDNDSLHSINSRAEEQPEHIDEPAVIIPCERTPLLLANA